VALLDRPGVSAAKRPRLESSEGSRNRNEGERAVVAIRMTLLIKRRAALTTLDRPRAARAY
jgi:hypothetical protein